jgi:hypothetical protein
MLSVESSRVVWLRSLRLALGRSSAVDEAVHIIAEKTVATGKLPLRMVEGKTSLAMTIAYRRAVRANLHRLQG